jgi:hypothetical protein
MQSVHFTTKVVSSNSVHGDAHSIQHYVITFLSVLLQVDGFLRALQFPPPIKLTATVREHLSSSPGFLLLLLFYYVSLLSEFCCDICYEFCCDICYEFRIKTIFGSSLLPVVCRRDHVFFGSFLLPVVCRRDHVLFTLCSVRLYPQLFVRGHMSYLRYVLFVFTSSCL